MRLLLSVAKKAFIVVIGVYLTVFVLVLVNQRSLIFLPSPLGEATPAAFDVPYDVVKIPVVGSEEIYAWWIHHSDDVARPTVVYCHGNGASLSSYARVSKIFYGLGWNALLFDYRGYGASTNPSGGLSEETVALDADAAYRWAIAKVPESSTVIWGHSLGSSVAARLASHHDPAGLILEGAFPSMYRMAMSRYPFFPILPFMVLDRFATLEYTQNRKYPVYIIHAENDAVIPLQYGQELYTDTPQPKDWLLLSGINHNDFPSVHEQYDGQIAAHVSEWIKAREGKLVATSLLSR